MILNNQKIKWAARNYLATDLGPREPLGSKSILELENKEKKANVVIQKTLEFVEYSKQEKIKQEKLKVAKLNANRVQMKVDEEMCALNEIIKDQCKQLQILHKTEAKAK